MKELVVSKDRDVLIVSVREASDGTSRERL